MAPDAHDSSEHGPAADERQYFFDKPKNLRLVMRGFYGACAIVFGLDVVNLIQHWMGAHELRHAEQPLEGLPEFYVIYGFVGVALLVLVAKEMRKLLMRDEDYYDR